MEFIQINRKYNTEFTRKLLENAIIHELVDFIDPTNHG
jgi:hypothetical protein